MPVNKLAVISNQKRGERGSKLDNMGDLHLALPALNLTTLVAGILIMVQQVKMMMFSLNMLDYSVSFLLLST